jgi:competence protein ComEA
MVGESRGTVVVWALAAVLGVVAIVRITDSDGDAPGKPVRVDRSPGSSDPAPGAAGPEGTGARAGVYVHVAGAVRRPGLVRVPAAARVAVAVARAGGPTRRAELAGVNLAAPVEDGQQVVVPLAGTVPGAVSAATTASPSGVKPSLGSATVDQLDEIDGIGPTLAERIVEYRTENGGFGSLDELQDVDGIGEKRFETLREALQP